MFNWFTKPKPPAERPAPGDPFAHPEVAAMSHRELSDLPLTPPPDPRAAARRGPRGETDACHRVLILQPKLEDTHVSSRPHPPRLPRRRAALGRQRQ
ncbi:hypothetical protein [Pseudooceanicola nanhaiensis]|uniref:hypothetical protein n=1 Tax=Pseudooceanicola nanhaiensis TaxID=375761 RepID=UPI004057D849